MKTLYRMTSTGAIQQWDIEVGDGFYEVKHGQQGGKIQTKRTNITKGKNIGRVNETTPQQQCEAEAISKWTKQKDRNGYTETIPTEKHLAPMLAKTYAKLGELVDGKHIKFPCYGQGKADGIRTMVFIDNGTVKLVSRKNKHFKALYHLEAEFSKIKGKYVLDGELYSEELTFQEITSAVKRDEPNELTEKIEVRFYDIIDDADYRVRLALLGKLVEDLNYCDVIDTCQIDSADDVDAQLDNYIKQGYEGLMLRNFDGPYKINGRSKDLQKYKKFIDAEFLITDIVPDKDGNGVWVCENEREQLFKATPKGTVAAKKEYLENKQKYIGQQATVRYFELTDGGVPRFPVGIVVRSYE